MLITMEITVGQQQLEHFGLILGAESRLNKSLKDTSRYTVKVAGIGTVANVVNTKPGKWNNVAVYASSPFYPSSNAQIRNLKYVSSSTFAALP